MAEHDGSILFPGNEKTVPTLFFYLIKSLIALQEKGLQRRAAVRHGAAYAEGNAVGRQFSFALAYPGAQTLDSAFDILFLTDAPHEDHKLIASPTAEHII